MRTKHFFNMVEIMLALGVCAIGVCSIMVLFPVGATATRDAAMETYAAHTADQMLHYLKYQLTEGGLWSEMIGGSVTLPDLGSDPRNSADNSNLDAFSASWSSSHVPNFDNIFAHTSNNGIYQIQSIRSGFADFRAIMFVWRSDISIAPGRQDIGVTLNVEVTWPAEIPYERREKALYCLEVFNSN
jgi:hypothetical protein